MDVNGPARWESSDPTVAEHAADRSKVIGYKPGNATITAYSPNNKSSACTVEVKQVVLNKTSLSLPEGDTEALIAGGTVTKWESSNEAVATVDGNGKVTGVAPGTATITATFKKVGEVADEKKLECAVTVTPVVFNLNATSLYLSEGKTATLTAFPNKGKVSWKSSNEAVATVDGNGKVTGIASGNAIITATFFNNTTVECAVNVTQAPLQTPLITSATSISGIDLKQDNISLSSVDAKECSINEPFIVTLDKEVELSPTKGLVVYFSRMSSNSAPTVIKVEGAVDKSESEDESEDESEGESEDESVGDGDRFETLGYGYLLYRGGTADAHTHEFSDRIYPQEPKKYKQFRLTVLETSDGGSVAHFGKFNLFAIGNEEPYPAGRKDPLHVANEYSLFYSKYTYQPNKGILSPKNQYDDNLDYYTDANGDAITATPWGEDAVINYKGVNFELPTFEEQPIAVANEEQPSGDPAIKGTQMPHVQTHELYAIPGDVISLSPFYDLPAIDNYKEKYSHWYSYNPEQGGAPQPQTYEHLKNGDHYLLDFLIDPTGIVRTDNAGFFAGENFPRVTDQTTTITNEAGENETYYLIHNYEALKSFADRVNSASADALPMNAILTGNIECAKKGVRIGTSDHPYRGKFDGNAYSIRNLGSELFGCIGAGTEISNLLVTGTNFETTEAAGILVDRVENSDAEVQTVTISNVIVSGEIRNNNDKIRKGGIIGEVEDGTNPINITLDHVVFVGDVSCSNTTPNGAIIGNLNKNTVDLDGCYVVANVGGGGTHAANGVGSADDPDNKNITGVGSCSLNIGNKEKDQRTSINIGDVYVPAQSGVHRILVYTEWDGIYAHIRTSSKVYLIEARPCVQYENSRLHYCNFSNDEWNRFLYKVEDGKTMFAASDWTNTLQSNKGEQTNYYTSFHNIPDGYQDIYITNVAKGSLTQSIPIPPMSRNTEVTCEGFLDQDRPDRRWYGTEATFYQPRNTMLGPTDLANISLGEKVDYYIAADFAHEFKYEGDDYNVDHGGKVIHEPVLAFRHVFHIMDGKKFAEENTSDQTKNENYLAKKVRKVSARAEQAFQIRLTTQVPVPPQQNANVPPVKTNFYYKKGESSYARVPYVGLEVYKKDNPNDKVTYKDMFKFDGSVATQGYRQNYPDAENGFGSKSASASKYYTGNGGGEVYRALFCEADKATEGTYIVRLVAKNGPGPDAETIHIFGSPDAPLYLDQYEITFLPENEASVVLDTDLYDDAHAEKKAKYYKHRPETLTQQYGDPAVVVDFDQYCRYEENADDLQNWFLTKVEDEKGNLKEIKTGAEIGEHRFVKWPMRWDKSTYSFGYGGYFSYDYNEYIIANHSSQVMFHSAVPSTGEGLYDRLYYDNKKKQATGSGGGANKAAESGAESGAGSGTESETQEISGGYFYYVNAASDPGVAARLPINRLCPGSTVSVSAWIAELSTAMEVANLCFNFVAVYGDGRREVLHSFVTGYIDDGNYTSSADRHNKENTYNKDRNGHWMHVYYSFIPDIPTDNVLDNIHYELELENNCVSSVGADYAVDDIRAYIIAPKITAQQLEPICDYNQKTVGIRLESRFENLLASNGLEEEKTAKPEEGGEPSPEEGGEESDESGIDVQADGDEPAAEVEEPVASPDLELYLAVLDKKSYDADHDIDKAIIKLQENNNDEVGKPYLPLPIFRDFNSQQWADKDVDDLSVYDKDRNNVPLRYLSASGEEFIYTNIKPIAKTDQGFAAGDECYIVLRDKELVDEYGTKAFVIDPSDLCEKICTITLQGSGVFKINGIPYRNNMPVEVCIGQTPVVQVSLQMKPENDQTTTTPTDKNPYDGYVDADAHYYDWYCGSLEEFMEPRKDTAGNSYSYYNLLATFRGTQIQGQQVTEGGDKDAEEFPELPEGQTDDLTPLRELVAQERLKLHSSSFIYPPMTQPDEADRIRVLTAMPILLDSDQQEGKFIVCSQPTEIKFRVADNAPKMYDGFEGDGWTYPTTDVPLRVGLKQLDGIAGITGVTVKSEKTDSLVKKIVKIGSRTKVLELPLRGITSYKGAVSETKDEEGNVVSTTPIGAQMNYRKGEEADPFVYLAGSDDPAYIGLDRHPGDTYPINIGLLPIGMMDVMTADNTQPGNKVTIVFSDQMKFREGYEYTVCMNFDETSAKDAEGYCYGQMVFTLKVVPEYMKWTGGNSRNWNNDANWSRVTKEELLTTNDDDFKPHTVDGGLTKDESGEIVGTAVNDNIKSFAPMDFTKVIVPNLTKELGADDEMKATNGYPVIFDATDNEKTAITVDEKEYGWSIPAPASSVGLGKMDQTLNIEWDMASLDLDGKLACRPWYANTCNQIHFNSGAEIIGQQYFGFKTNYQRAWVDMEMKGKRWYTLGSPLKHTVAGDMYTRTTGAYNQEEGGKQDTELFTKIEFNTTDYDRYKPAVYQRGWNKSTATNWVLNTDDGPATKKKAVVDLNWSRVYNAVDEAYTPGIGFSIRTVTDNIITTDDEPTVRFRLPKNDANYDYFKPEGDGKYDHNNTEIARSNDEQYSLIDFTATPATVGETEGGTEGDAEGDEAPQVLKYEVTLDLKATGEYYLVGNPFMAHLDMNKFLKGNRSVINGNKYWIMTEDRQEAVVWDEKSEMFMTSDADKNGDLPQTGTGFVAPMQGFFVQAQNKGTSITLTFTPDMVYDNFNLTKGGLLRVGSRSGIEPEIITVSALNADKQVTSRAIINIDADADDAYNSAEDGQLLIDRTLGDLQTVYSVASGQALSINRLNAIVETEIGVIANESAATTLLFEGVDEIDGLLLLDTATGEFTEMSDGMTVDVKGSASGRFYITRKTESLVDPTLVVVCNERSVNVVSTSEGIIARVYTPAGMYLGQWSTDESALQFDVDPGIIIVEAVSDNQRVVRKFVVK